MNTTKLKRQFFEIKYEDGGVEFIYFLSAKKAEDLIWHIYERANTPEERKRGNVLRSIDHATEYDYTKWSLTMALKERLTTNPN